MAKRSRQKSQDPANYQAQRFFIGITFVMVFISLIGFLGSMYWFYLDTIGQLPFDFSRSTGVYFIAIFLLYVVGLIGLLKPQPPLHHAATIASMINVAISAILVFGAGNSQGLLIGVITTIHVYLGFRFPINLNETSNGSRMLQS